MQFNEKLCSIELAFVWKKQQECKLKEITNMMKERCNNIEIKNTLAKLLQRRPLTQLREINFSCGKG